MRTRIRRVARPPATGRNARQRLLQPHTRASSIPMCRSSPAARGEPAPHGALRRRRMPIRHHPRRQPGRPLTHGMASDVPSSSIAADLATARRRGREHPDVHGTCYRVPNNDYADYIELPSAEAVRKDKKTSRRRSKHRVPRAGPNPRQEASCGRTTSGVSCRTRRLMLLGGTDDEVHAPALHAHVPSHS